MLPTRLKSLLRSAVRPLLPTSWIVKPRAALHDYWRDPHEDGNRAEAYLEDGAPALRSRYLVDLVRRHLGPETRILEIGCNAGRNLHFLYEAGFHNLAGIEISPPAVALLRKTFPEMAATIELFNAPVEQAIRDLPDGRFDLVFTVAVLEHIHPESNWIFAEIARVAKRLVLTIEDERNRSWRHVPRRYDRVFVPLGMEMVHVHNNGPREGLSTATVTRLFRKPTAPN